MTTAPGTPVASPCSGVCRIDAPSGLCAGCRRTLDEIARWSAMDDAERRGVWQRLALRRVEAAAPDAAAGGSAADASPARPR